MTNGTVIPHRLLAAAFSLALATLGALPGTTFSATRELDLIATLELPEGDLIYPVELNKLHYFDEDDSPFAVQVIDGCALDGSLWIFGAGFMGASVPLRITDLVSRRTERIVLPPFLPGAPVGTVLVPDALTLCEDGPTGGLPPLEGSVTFTAAAGRGNDFSEDLELRSEGSRDGYRRLITGDFDSQIISRRSPVVAIDGSGAYDQLYLLAEARTPRQMEGIVFSGDEGMRPSKDRLEKALKRITTARVRRAFETAKNGRVPKGIIEDLGLRKVENVHHLDLELETIGSDHYLARAGWIKKNKAIRPPQLVEERFAVELARADGKVTQLPLVGPLVGSEVEGDLWQYRSEDAFVEIIDACEIGGRFWTVAAALTEEPLELRVTDTRYDESVSHLLWTDRAELSRMSDGAALATCP